MPTPSPDRQSGGCLREDRNHRSGFRQSINLKWSYVDLERGFLLLPDSETVRKTIGMSRVVMALLVAADRTADFVISGATPNKPRADLKKPWSALQKYCKLTDVRLHDLRHTFASIGAGASLGLPIVGKLLSHSQPATTARYAHPLPVRLARSAILLVAAMTSDGVREKA